MAGLQADIISGEFLKNFLPETIYVLPEDNSAPVNQSEAPASIAEASPALEAKATPAIPRLPQAEAAPVAKKAFEIIGENRKGVAVLVTLPDDQFKNLPQLDFLQKILSAIGLISTDVAYVNNKSGAIASFEELQQALEVNYLISFASRIDTDKPHEKFTLYKPVVVDQVPVVFAQSLAIIEKDVEHKKLLWAALKQMFL